MDRNLQQFEIAERNLSLLKLKCKRGMFSENLFGIVCKWKHYSLKDLKWMESFISDNNQQIASNCLECLVKNGANLNDFMEIIKSRIKDRVFSNKVIEMAEFQNKPDILLFFMEEDDFYINKVILALKRTGNESYLTTLMLTDNEILLKSINRIIK